VRQALPLLLFSLFLACASHAQEIRYISDKQYIPVRSGAGNQYRVTHKGLPSGTRLTVRQMSDDGVWAEIVTDGGTEGWIRAQYLMQEVPAEAKLGAALKRAEESDQRAGAMAAELATLKGEQSELETEAADSSNQAESLAQELAQLKQISGNAVQLDADNRRLVVEAENLRSELNMLQAENRRLEDKLQSEDFLNGALAVLLGVIITLVVPRLWPKRRKSSSWA